MPIPKARMCGVRWWPTSWHGWWIASNGPDRASGTHRSAFITADDINNYSFIFSFVCLEAYKLYMELILYLLTLYHNRKPLSSVGMNQSNVTRSCRKLGRRFNVPNFKKNGNSWERCSLANNRLHIRSVVINRDSNLRKNTSSGIWGMLINTPKPIHNRQLIREKRGEVENKIKWSASCICFYLNACCFDYLNN